MHDIDIVVIGAGAAGVAAARRLAASPWSVLVLEARPRVGGRAWTVDACRLPLDLGCGWLHSADVNEWSGIAKQLGFEIDPMPPPWSRRAYDTSFSIAKQNDFTDAWRAFYARVEQAGEQGADRPAADLLDPNSRWNGLLNALSSYINGVELDQLSVKDYSQYRDTGINWRVVAGYGRLIETFAQGINIRLACPVSVIDHSGRQLRIRCPLGSLRARAAIITVPPSVIANGLLRFEPALDDKLQAVAALPLGAADKLFLRVDEPDRLPLETRAFGAIDRTATGSYHLRPFARAVIEGYFGGKLAQELENAGDGAFGRFAVDELASLWGNHMRTRLHPIVASAWSRDPYAGGSYSYARVGHSDARARLAEPVDERLFFAGEACSIHDFSTAHGAFRTGVQASDLVLKALRSAI